MKKMKYFVQTIMLRVPSGQPVSLFSRRGCDAAELTSYVDVTQSVKTLGILNCCSTLVHHKVAHSQFTMSQLLHNNCNLSKQDLTAENVPTLGTDVYINS